jgi:N utilization substance protein A
MPEKIKLTSEELGLMSLFTQISGATSRDCVIDPKLNRVIFIVNPGEMGLAIGKNGAVIRNIQNAVGRDVELVEYAADPKDFIVNSLNRKYVTNVRLSEKLDGTRTAVVVVEEKGKGAVVGRGGRNAEKARLLAKRYHDISNVQIVTQ